MRAARRTHAALAACLCLIGFTGIVRAEGLPRMRLIPPGEFAMGTDGADSMPNERPSHRVKLDGFLGLVIDSFGNRPLLLPGIPEYLYSYHDMSILKS